MKVDIGPYPRGAGERRAKIRIDKSDTWSMDSTLALIIVPMLKQLKKSKHGVSWQHFPEGYNELTSSKEYYAEKKNGPLHKKERAMFKQAIKAQNAWFDEMIWAFTQLNIDWEKKYHTGRIDFEHVPLKNEKGEVYAYELVRGKKDTSKYDVEGRNAHAKRMQDAFTSFGKHFMDLWD